MRSLIQAFKADRATYYRLDSMKKEIRESVLKKYASFLLIGIISAFSLSSENEEAINASIAAMSIVLGFAFSVLVFFATQDPLSIRGEVARERRLAKDRANKLADELFDNITYFVYSALSFVVISCILLFLEGEESVGARLVDTVFNDSSLTYIKTIKSVVSGTNDILLRFVKFLMILTLLESVYTFFRTVRRIVFYFEERRKFNKIEGAGDRSR
jgi:hypothetical protein